MLIVQRRVLRLREIRPLQKSDTRICMHSEIINCINSKRHFFFTFNISEIVSVSDDEKFIPVKLAVVFYLMVHKITPCLTTCGTFLFMTLGSLLPELYLIPSCDLAHPSTDSTYNNSFSPSFILSPPQFY